MRSNAGLLLTVFACSMAFGQGTDAKPQFEVVSIKPAPPPVGGMIRIGRGGGPGSKDPGRYTATNQNLFSLILEAYDIKPYQLTGPAYLQSERFDITAKVPEGTSKEQLKLMLQSMLEDRFKMVVHKEKKEMPVYELVVAKGGLKMKESVVEPPTATDGGPNAGGAPPPPPFRMDGGPPQLGKDGFPVMPAAAGGRGPMMMMMNGRAKMQSSQTTMDQVVNMLANQIGRPITDATALKGKYDVSLYFSPEGLNSPMGGALGMMRAAHGDGGAIGAGGGGGAGVGPLPADGETGPNIFTAIQEQLGLKLEQKKGMVDLIIVDKMEKAPTEN